MRKVGEFKKEIRAKEFAEFLLKKNITSLLEEDQGIYAVWVHDEGHIEQAKKYFDDFSKVKGFISNPFIKEKTEKSPTNLKLIRSNGYVTRGLIVICSLIFALGVFQTYAKADTNNSLKSFPPIVKALIIDYPQQSRILDQLIDKYGAEKVKANTLPEEAQSLIKEHNTNAPWIGIYNILLSSKENRKDLWDGKLFGDVRRGEVWRLFTPAILHTGLLHLLFNILWLSLLGRMIEFNIGKLRLILFILFTALISNVCQYLISGPYFMGISGVLSAFIGFIWVRKKIAPWEVYLVSKQTLYFFMIFILGFLALQIAAFFLQLFSIYSIPLAIANTAHISGFLVGLFVGRFKSINPRG